MPRAIVKGLLHFIIIYGSALVLMFYSEFFFLNEGPVQDVVNIINGEEGSSILGLLEFALFYALFAVWLLLPIFYFRIRRFWALYLAAGFFGLATEGLVIPLIYTESLIWPALSWHILADVMLGWYVVRWILGKNKPILTILLAIGLGLFWAYWAQWAHEGSERLILSPEEFSSFAAVAGAVLLLGYAILNIVRQVEFRPSRLELVAWSVVTLALWVPMLIREGIPMFAEKPVNALMLPLYLGVSIFTLYRHGRIEIRENVLSVLRPGIAWWNLLLFVLMPATAILTYPIFWRHQMFPPTSFIVLLLNVSAYVLIVLALVMLWRDIRTSHPL